MSDKDVFLTEKVHAKLKEKAQKKEVGMEALGNTLLMLSLCDEEKVNQAVNLIEGWDLGGVANLEKKGL